jgi:hypothetical protein
MEETIIDHRLSRIVNQPSSQGKLGMGVTTAVVIIIQTSSMDDYSVVVLRSER